MTSPTTPTAPPPALPALRATYRLQMHGGFPLAEARAAVAYLARLGVSHAYLSPILQARRGSTHGYDVTDPQRLNAELGDEGERRALLAALRERGMGLLLDIVPNHMAVTHENPYWMDVLEHGRASRWARWFDIDWHAPSEALRGRVLLPVLGNWFPEVLAAGELTLRYEHGRLLVRYWENRFPVDPQTAPRVLRLGLDAAREAAGGDDAAALAELDALLERFAALPPRTTRSAAQRARRQEEAPALWEALAALVARAPAVRAHVEHAAADFAAGEAGPARMRRFLDRQPYSLVFWRRAAQEINYRRFFNINELVALHMEDPEVFAETHALLLDWARDGGVDGLRIDHIDGLRDPKQYLERLREAVDARRSAAAGDGRFPILVEKILSPGEHLRQDWPVEGTTGYETLNDLEAVFLDPDGYADIERRYAGMLHLDERGVDFAAVALAGKRKVLRGSLASDVLRLVKLLLPIARRDPRTSALSREALNDAIVETIAALGVYRTYVDATEPAAGPRATPDDVAQVERAVATARERAVAEPAALDLLREVLLLEGLEERDAEDRLDRRRFTSRFQQISGPATAKGVEDTALYLYVPLLPRNEVGGEPDRELAHAVDVLHAANAERAEHWPRALVTVSTHDTKRGADTRARLDVLSEIPGEWWAAVERWQRHNRSHRRRVGRRWAPDLNTEYMLYQTMVGIWPVPDDAGAPAVPDHEVLEELRVRLRAYMEKAVREGKSRSGWVDQNPEFEAALADFVDALLDVGRSGAFLADLGALARRIAPAGYWNGLARTLLHLTVPGVPDVYQGTELWDFTLVDPDNRRPVDFALRSDLLDRVVSAYSSVPSDGPAALLRELIQAPGEGGLKLLLMHRVLQVRRERDALFGQGGYEPLPVEGARARHAIAFARRAPSGAEAALVIAPRLTMALADGAPPLGEEAWGDTAVRLPAGLETAAWRCALTGREQHARNGLLWLRHTLAESPVGLLLTPS